MIDRVAGILIEKSPMYCVLDCQGIGMGIHISLSTFQDLETHPLNSRVTLYTHLYVREDVFQLYGFSRPEEREMFRHLIGISGVGPRVALAVLSGIRVEELQDSIATGDVEILTRIPGVGRKTAQRIVLELREKVGKELVVTSSTDKSVVPAGKDSKFEEAVLALVALGYKSGDAEKAVRKAALAGGNDLSLEELIKQALKQMTS